MDRLYLEIVTPSGRALHDTVDEVTAPSTRGEFGVLPGHLPILASLRAGIVSYRHGGDVKKLAIADGLAQAGPDKVLILTDDFREREDIDPVAVRQELAEVQASLHKADTTPVDRKTLIAREGWLAALLDLHGGEAIPAVMRPGDDWDAPKEEEFLEPPSGDAG